MKRSFIPILTAINLAACGGGDISQADAEPREDALKAAVPIQTFGANPVSIWNGIAYATAGNVTGHDLVTVHLAMYDAVMAIAGTHQPYNNIRLATSGAGAGEVAMEAAAIEAAYRVLKGLFPTGGVNRVDYETAYANGIAAVADGDDKTRGMAIGAEVAAGMLALRANDGRATVLPPYVPGTLPGQFRGTNPVNRIAPYVKPFATLSHSQFRAPGPPALDSDTYTLDFNEVKLMASASSTQRSDAQTEVARFFTEPPSPWTFRNLRQFATAHESLVDNARLTAMMWTAYQDGLSSCFETKYHFNFWRPTSAVQLADSDGNAATVADAAWTPVVTTPNHPEYPSAHNCATGAVMEIVRDFYGTKKLKFSFDSTVTGTTHHYESTDELIKDNTNGRVWGGMHFRTSNEHGAELGKQVAKWVAKNHFQAIK